MSKNTALDSIVDQVDDVAVEGLSVAYILCLITEVITRPFIAILRIKPIPTLCVATSTRFYWIIY